MTAPVQVHNPRLGLARGHSTSMKKYLAAELLVEERSKRAYVVCQYWLVVLPQAADVAVAGVMLCLAQSCFLHVVQWRQVCFAIVSKHESSLCKPLKHTYG